jgi:hypothetical protein
MLAFWIATPCGLLDRYQHFKGKYFLNIQLWRWRQCVPPRCQYSATSPHAVKTQKTNINSSVNLYSGLNNYLVN